MGEEAEAPVVSTEDAMWQEECGKLKGGRFRITKVRTVSDINFILAFAAVHQLSLTAGDGAFLVQPRIKV